MKPTLMPIEPGSVQLAIKNKMTRLRQCNKNVILELTGGIDTAKSSPRGQV